MNKYHVALTQSEIALLGSINFSENVSSHIDRHNVFKANGDLILSLLSSLNERSAIPEIRLLYWNDPAYNQGRTKTSRKGLFERNGCSRLEIYKHPHFIPCLRYFLFGADLPCGVILAFEEKVGNPEWISSGDIVPLGKFLQQLVRNEGLDVVETPEEFFKLCLDMGLGLSNSESILKSLSRMR